MRSLRRRLVVVVVTSVATGFLLTAALTWRIVSDAATRDFDTRLANALGELALAVDFGDDKILSLSREPEDPAFNRPNSGWYWRIAKGDLTLARSRSLRLGELPAIRNAAAGGEPGEPPRPLTLPASGPSGEDLRLRHRVVQLRDGAILLDITVAGLGGDIGREVWLSMRWLLLGLAIIAAILSGLLIGEIRSGLRPLRILAEDIERANALGEIARLKPSSYRELNPLDIERQRPHRTGRDCRRARPRACRQPCPCHQDALEFDFRPQRDEGHGAGQRDRTECRYDPPPDRPSSQASTLRRQGTVGIRSRAGEIGGR